MLSKSKQLAEIKEKAGFLASQAKHQLEKWHFEAKKNTVGVSLNDRLQHTLRCLKYDALKARKKPLSFKKSVDNPWYKEPKN